MRWKTINSLSDLDLLPRNEYQVLFSKNILVSSTKAISINDVFLMYYNYEDGYFHFPSYDIGCKDIKLKPVIEINKWMSCPDKPKMKSNAL